MEGRGTLGRVEIVQGEEPALLDLITSPQLSPLHKGLPEPLCPHPPNAVAVRPDSSAGLWPHHLHLALQGHQSGLPAQRGTAWQGSDPVPGQAGLAAPGRPQEQNPLCLQLWEVTEDAGHRVCSSP